jgi:YegS/Rv2252/BmrU family lipid kinase
VTDPPYRRVHVVVNPAAGKDQPILNVLSDVFGAHEVDWDVSVSKRSGDAFTQATTAIAAGVDLVAGYGGDGTQHEIANAVVSAATETGSRTPMAILPGGTGNGFAREMSVPGTLREAAELLCTSTNTRTIDVGRLTRLAPDAAGARYFIQRLYVGIEPEEQTSRELKDRYGVFAYAVNMARHAGTPKEHHYEVDVDGTRFTFEASKLYVINSGMMGTGLQISHRYAVEDGLLDAFAIDNRTLDTLIAAAARFLDLPLLDADRYYRQGRSISIETDPDQAVWADGEYLGRTPVTVDVVPGALTVVVP